jgi:hypothetical protein
MRSARTLNIFLLVLADCIRLIFSPVFSGGPRDDDASSSAGLICFFPDEEGALHYSRGMMTEFTVALK